MLEPELLTSIQGPCVRDHGDALEPGCVQDRRDVEPEAVRDEREWHPAFLGPCDERCERRVERTLGDGQFAHLLDAGAQHGGLMQRGLTQSHLVTVDQLAVPLPRLSADGFVPERTEQDHRDVGEACGSVEVDDDGSDREHLFSPPSRRRGVP